MRRPQRPGGHRALFHGLEEVRQSLPVAEIPGQHPVAHLRSCLTPMSEEDFADLRLLNAAQRPRCGYLQTLGLLRTEKFRDRRDLPARRIEPEHPKSKFALILMRMLVTGNTGGP